MTVHSISNNVSKQDVDQVIDKLKQANDELRKELVLCHKRITFLERDTLRLKMLLEGKDIMMNSLPWSIDDNII